MKDVSIENEGPIAEINIIPFVDIILVILISFMVTAPILSKMGFHIDLPQFAEASKMEKEAVQIFLNKNGDLFLNENQVDQEDLELILMRQAPSLSELKVLVSADQDVLHGKVVSLVDWLRRLGVLQIGIEAHPSSVKK